jgi:alkyl hydroperoxide reductase subunit AhpC
VAKEEYNYRSHKDGVSPWDNFRTSSKIRVGKVAPDFVATDLDSKVVTLSSFRGKKNVVLQFGCATCAPFIEMVNSGEAALESLYERYRDKGFEFFIVYVREAHPGSRLTHHDSIQQKKDHAEILRTDESLEIPIIVDDLAGTIHRSYGSLPYMIFVINKEGIIVHRADRSDPTQLPLILDNLLMLDSSPTHDNLQSSYSETLRSISKASTAVKSRVSSRAEIQSTSDTP